MGRQLGRPPKRRSSYFGGWCTSYQFWNGAWSIQAPKPPKSSKSIRFFENDHDFWKVHEKLTLGCKFCLICISGGLKPLNHIFRDHLHSSLHFCFIFWAKSRQNEVHILMILDAKIKNLISELREPFFTRKILGKSYDFSRSDKLISKHFPAS